jgi:GYF domain 2
VSASAEPIWYIKVRETIYGPYGDAKMRSFAGEGRLGGHSMVRAGQDGEFAPASEVEALATILALPRTGGTKTERPAQNRRFVIFAQISQNSHATFMETLSGFGVAIEAMPNVWLLSAQASAANLRNAMSRVLDSEDSLFITDASKGTSAWFNVGQNTDKRIREFWQESE